ncbi:Protein of unknown function [Nitrosomonas marina]|uniref:Carboxypeptidase regulatory-like domain-containing protein n=1 Tax=Nitrosomonas marina TaxID=917 RepID=A0A1H9Y4V4_9PROT|nr:Pvc16 family protein [Nitrosomonas marina]SES63798.1 Protein of unknown function [Nitrosomonas marina]
MIDEIDRRLKEWITMVIDGQLAITFEHPGTERNQPTVSVYLYDMEYSTPNSTTREIPFQISLSYLLTVQSDDQVESHKYLGKILYAAKSQSDMEVGFPALPAQFWQAIGIAPLPHFSLQIPLMITRETEHIPTIKAQPHIGISSVTQITGVVVGPSDQPIPGAKIMLPHSKTVAYTNNKGLFSIAADANLQRAFNCKIDAKGKQFSISVPMQQILKTPHAPFTIHLDLEV